MAEIAVTPDSLHTTITTLEGFSFREDASAAAVVNIRQTSASGLIIFRVDLAADGVLNADGLGKEGRGRSFPDGVYVEEVSGSVEGTLFGE